MISYVIHSNCRRAIRQLKISVMYLIGINQNSFAKKMVTDFHDKGLRLCANIKPCLLKDHPLFNELKEKKDVYNK